MNFWKKMMINFQPSRIFNHRILFGWIFRERKRIFKFFLNELLKKKIMVTNFQSSNSFLKKKIMVTNFQSSNLFWKRKWWSNFQSNRIFDHRILFEWIFRGRKQIFKFFLNELLKKKMIVMNFQSSNSF